MTLVASEPQRNAQIPPETLECAAALASGGPLLLELHRLEILAKLRPQVIAFEGELHGGF